METRDWRQWKREQAENGKMASGCHSLSHSLWPSSLCNVRDPTEHFTVLETQKRSIDKIYAVHKSGWNFFYSRVKKSSVGCLRHVRTSQFARLLTTWQTVHERVHKERENETEILLRYPLTYLGVWVYIRVIAVCQHASLVCRVAFQIRL